MHEIEMYISMSTYSAQNSKKILFKLATDHFYVHYSYTEDFKLNTHDINHVNRMICKKTYLKRGKPSGNLNIYNYSYC